MSDLWTYRDTSIGDVDIVGFKVEATDGDIGKVDEASYDVGQSRIVVDTGPWIFGKKVVLPAGLVQRVDTADERIFVARTKDDIKNAPEYDESMGFSDDYRTTLGEYYGERAGARREL